MKKLALLCIFFSLTAFSQEEDQIDFSDEIDRQVWKPFIEAFDSGNAASYLKVHKENVIRISSGGIRQGEEYKARIQESFSRGNRNRSIDLKFEHRVHSKNLAYEVGYYRVKYHQDGVWKESFGRFNVLLEKENGIWKIAQDWDIDHILGSPITEKDFNKL